MVSISIRVAGSAIAAGDDVHFYCSLRSRQSDTHYTASPLVEHRESHLFAVVASTPTMVWRPVPAARWGLKAGRKPPSAIVMTHAWALTSAQTGRGLAPRRAGGILVEVPPQGGGPGLGLLEAGLPPVAPPGTRPRWR